MKHSLISQTFRINPRDVLLSVIFIVVLSAFGISSGVASDKNEAKHSGKITKARAERIALTKVPGGIIRSAAASVARNWRRHEDSASGPVILRSPDRNTPK